MNKHPETGSLSDNCPEGLPYSTVEPQDTMHKDCVKKLIHQVETHPNREALNADLEQNQAYNPFSEKSKDMIRSMEIVEYFEMCEISTQIQFALCLTYCTKGIVYCRCGFCRHPTDKTRELNKNRFDVLSIPNYVIHQVLECADAHEALSSRPWWGVQQSRNPGGLCNESVCPCLS